MTIEATITPDAETTTPAPDATTETTEKAGPKKALADVTKVFEELDAKQNAAYEIADEAPKPKDKPKSKVADDDDEADTSNDDDVEEDDDDSDSADDDARDEEDEDDEAEDDDEDDIPKSVRLIDPDLLSRAVAVGITLDEAREFPTDDGLKRAVDLIEARSSQSAPDTTGKDRKSPAAVSTDGAQEFTFDWTHPDMPELTEEDIAPQIRENMKRLKDHYEGQMAAIRNQVDVLVQSHRRQQTDATVKRLDSLFNELGPEFTKFVGKGELNDLGRTSKEGQIRSQIVSAMVGLSGSVKASEGDLFKMAVNAVLGDQSKELVREQLRSKIDKRNTQKTRRPAARKTPKAPRDPMQRTLAELKQKGLIPS